MNYHPIFVHFPIALLTVYTICEFIRFKQIKKHVAWFYVKAVLVITGTAGATAALFTGDGARQAVLSGVINARVADPRAVINLHETFAKGASLIFLIIAIGYAIAWLDKLNIVDYLHGSLLKSFWGILVGFQKILTDSPLIIVLSIFGLIAITIAGSLGGSIIYGPNTDPMVHFIYGLFFH